MGLGIGPSNDDEGFFVSADFKCFRKGCEPGKGPNNDDKGFFVFLISTVSGRGCGAKEGAH